MIAKSEVLEKAILQTLAYSAHFHFPLTQTEIYRRLQSLPAGKAGLPRRQAGSEPCKKSAVDQALYSLVQAGRVLAVQDYYVLAGQSHLVAHRRARQSSSRHLLARAKTKVATLARCPGVQAIYVTGSLAVANASESDDIDLMVITTPHRLWLTRLLLTTITSLRGWRRTPHATNVSGKVCLNLYLTLDALSLPAAKRSLYAAYELIQALPLYDPHDTQSELLAANSWIGQYLANQKRTLLNRRPGRRPSRDSEAGRRVLNGFDGVLDLLDDLAFSIQYAYMRPKITREYVTRDAAFFHPHDPAPPAHTL